MSFKAASFLARRFKWKMPNFCQVTCDIARRSESHHHWQGDRSTPTHPPRSAQLHTPGAAVSIA